MQTNKRANDHTRSLRKVQRTTKRRNKRGSNRKRGLTLQEQQTLAFERLFCSPGRVVPISTFGEQQFGSIYKPGQDQWCQLSKEVASDLSAKVVSLALFDGDQMLFACTGIALPRGTSRLHLTRFLTSSRLVTVFNEKRNIDDQLRVEVRLPNEKTITGILGLYDQDIAIVTSVNLQNVGHVDLDLPESDATTIVAAGRAFKSCSLMATTGMRSDALDGDDHKHLAVSYCPITEAGLGGPLIDPAGNFVGVNIHCDSDTGKTWFLPSTSLRERLEHFEILTPRNMQGGHDARLKRTDDGNPYGAGFSSGKTKNSRCRSYSPPSGVSNTIPSGFMETWKWLESMGYPKPPPLMLELNGQLRNKFEEVFGWILAWKTYTDFVPFGSGINPWPRLGHMIRTIHRCVVSLASFNGNTRFFACTGFLVKCPSKCGRMRSVIVTSASLVRTGVAEDTIDENLRIEVFLPPYQRLNGTLESYHSNYNIAIVSAKGLHYIRPQDILSQQESLLAHVAAIGREPEEGLLCASLGKVTVEPSRFVCKDLGLSTCDIKKPGIGGPLINVADGCLAGMNFYDGRTGRTPFLPRQKICEVLLLFGNNSPWGRRENACDDIMSGGDHCVRRLDEPNEKNLNKWRVPEPYWYHGLLEVDMFDPLPLPRRGRILD